MDELVRIAKYLGNLGYASRREIEKWIDQGQIAVNGEVISDKGRKIRPAVDVVLVKGKKIVNDAKMVYLMMNKPPGVVSTVDDPEGRPTVIDLVTRVMNKDKRRKKFIKVHPVGRLDMESRGLILLMNDGELTHRLTHPKYHVPRRYVVKVKGQLTARKLAKLRNGVVLREGVTSKTEVMVMEHEKVENLEIARKVSSQTKGSFAPLLDVQSGRGRKTVRPKVYWLEMVLFEGWHRQIRRMCGVLGLEVLDLKRIEMGPMALGELAEGDIRELSPDEVASLQTAVGLAVSEDTRS